MATPKWETCVYLSNKHCVDICTWSHLKRELCLTYKGPFLSRFYLGSSNPIVTFLAVTTSLADRFGVFQGFFSKWCFHKENRASAKKHVRIFILHKKEIFLNLNFYFMRVNCARHIRNSSPQCAKDIFLNLNFYFKRSTKKHKCARSQVYTEVGLRT